MSQVGNGPFYLVNNNRLRRAHLDPTGVACANSVLARQRPSPSRTQLLLATNVATSRSGRRGMERVHQDPDHHPRVATASTCRDCNATFEPRWCQAQVSTRYTNEMKVSSFTHQSGLPKASDPHRDWERAAVAIRPDPAVDRPS